jgi:hypothetical protein
VFENQIEFYPTPETGLTVTLRYKRLSQPLIDGEDEHELPTQLERKLLEYAKAQSRFMDGDFQAGRDWLALYEQGLPPVSSGRDRFFTRPIAFSRQPNAWDLQAEAKHI